MPVTVQLSQVEKHSRADWSHFKFMATSSSRFLVQPRKSTFSKASLMYSPKWTFYTLHYFLRLLILPLFSSFSADDLASHITKNKQTKNPQKQWKQNFNEFSCICICAHTFYLPSWYSGVSCSCSLSKSAPSLMTWFYPFLSTQRHWSNNP